MSCQMLKASALTERLVVTLALGLGDGEGVGVRLGDDEDVGVRLEDDEGVALGRLRGVHPVRPLPAVPNQ